MRLTTQPDWPTGPLPISAGTTTATTQARSSYFSPRSARILYGTPKQPSRWHRFLDGPDASGAFGVELLVPDPDTDRHAALGIVHVTAGPDGQAALLELLRCAARRRDTAGSLPDVDELVCPFGTSEPGSPTFTVAFLSSVGRLTRPPGTDRRLGWSPAQAWLWALASRTNPSDYPPDPEYSPQLLAGTVVLSADWRGLITRDGAAFVALRRDHGPSDAFLGYGQLYTHTTYLDALLLGMIHRTSVEQLIAESAVAFDAPDLGRHLERLEQRITRFRSIYWLRDASSHGPANDILNAYQAQHDLPERFNAVREEIADLGRAVEARAAQRIGAALGVLTIVGLPSGAALEILQALNAHTGRDLTIALTAAFAVTGVLLATRVGRLLIRQIRSLR